jgi:hypothetical protein
MKGTGLAWIMRYSFLSFLIAALVAIGFTPLVEFQKEGLCLLIKRVCTLRVDVVKRIEEGKKMGLMTM